MIILTKLDQTLVLIPIEAIKYVEKTPDTVIFFLNGERIFVKESIEEVQEKFLEFQAKVLRKSNDSNSSTTL